MAKPKKHYGKWRIRPTDEKGRRESLVYETYQEALHELQKREVENREIKFGHKRLVQRHKSFGDLCDKWLIAKANKRSIADDKSIISCHLRPRFADFRINQVTSDRVNEFSIDITSKLSQKTVFNILTLLLSMLRLAKKIDWLSEVPQIEKPKIKVVSSDFNFLQTTEEIRRFLAAAETRGKDFHSLYLTAVCTGMREGELAGLKWSDVDLSLRIIQVRHSFEGPTKSGEPRPIPILDPLFECLIQWRRFQTSEWVFPNRANTMLKPSSRIFQESFQKVLQTAGLGGGAAGSRLVFHDLRHTFSSHWVMAGGDVFKLQKILGHANIAMTMRYAHLAPNAFSTDLSRLSSFTPSRPATMLAMAPRLRKS